MPNSKLTGDGFAIEAKVAVLLEGLVKEKVLRLANFAVEGGFCCCYLVDH